MGESAEKKAERLRREAAVRQILSGERTGQEVADEFELSRQAVSLWVQRYKKAGDLIPGKRGRKKLKPLDEFQKREFFYHILGIYRKKGYSVGDEVPRRDVVWEREVRDKLKEVSGQPASATLTRKLMKELELPPYFNPFINFNEEEDWDDDFYTLRDPFNKAAAPAKKKVPQRPESLDDPDDDKIPTTPEEYEKWLEETQQMLKKRGIHYDPAKMEMIEDDGLAGPSHAPAVGVRVGKHAKNKRQSPPKRRKNKGKKRKKKR